MVDRAGPQREMLLEFSLTEKARPYSKALPQTSERSTRIRAQWHGALGWTSMVAVIQG